MTDGERKLWSELRQFRRWYGIHVRRQAPIGWYIADFAIHERGLVIEIDGEHHLMADRMAKDRIRDQWLGSQGYRVLRFTTSDITDSFDGCIEEVLHALGLMAEDRGNPGSALSSRGRGDAATAPRGR